MLCASFSTPDLKSTLDLCVLSGKPLLVFQVSSHTCGCEGGGDLSELTFTFSLLLVSYFTSAVFMPALDLFLFIVVSFF